MEARFGHDFSRVRVHDGAPAEASATALDARAYTVGTDVVLGAGRYEPWSSAGRRLLAHELAHVVQQSASVRSGIVHLGEPSAESEADSAAARVDGAESTSEPLRVSRRPVTLQAQAQPPAAGGMTREDFARRVLIRFGIQRVVTGTQAQQTTELTPRGGMPPGGITLPGWQAWDPSDASPFYESIIDAMVDFAGAIGGLPVVSEIVFYNVDYTLAPGAAVATPQPDSGASFGAGRLTIYRAATTSNKWLPAARSNVAGTYPPVVVGVGGVPGQSPGAPLPLPTREQSERRILAHELGHGLAEAAMAADPATFDAFRAAAGWTLTNPPELYDVQAPGVAAAIAARTPPPASARITEDSWNSPTLREQPLTNYSVAGGPGEDFAEAVMAFVHAPELLRSRSPARHGFLAARLDRWLPHLIRLPQVGDFPSPEGVRRVA
jgi:uncharacterized protein DUF4157